MGGQIKNIWWLLCSGAVRKSVYSFVLICNSRNQESKGRIETCGCQRPLYGLFYSFSYNMSSSRSPVSLSSNISSWLVSIEVTFFMVLMDLAMCASSKAKMTYLSVADLQTMQHKIISTRKVRIKKEMLYNVLSQLSPITSERWWAGRKGRASHTSSMQVISSLLPSTKCQRLPLPFHYLFLPLNKSVAYYMGRKERENKN